MAVLPGIVLLAFSVIYPNALGMGDGIVMIICGFITDTYGILLILCLAMSGLILSSLFAGNRNTKMPFIPYITVAFCIIKFIYIHNVC